MTQEPTRQNSNTRVTMAVLGVKIDNLTEKVDGVAAQQDKLWVAHVQIHTDQEKRLRDLESCAHEERPIEQRVNDLEKWQEGQKVRTGRLAGLQVVISAALASISGWLSSRA